MGGFPWADWLKATSGDLWPLGLWIAGSMAYYMAGLARLLCGLGPWRDGDGPSPPELPGPEDFSGGPPA